jgi:hypothetical protein
MSKADSTARKREQARLRARRYRARKRGEHAPKLRCGVPKGYKQTPEHIAKRTRCGKDHHAWKAGEVSPKLGRKRALHAYPESQPCEKCGNKKTDRHHIDGDTSNNSKGNIAWLCRRCHMKEDGRLVAFTKLAIANQQNGRDDEGRFRKTSRLNQGPDVPPIDPNAR